MHSFRQGDVPLYPVAEIPAGLAKIEPENGRTILAYGERTGHAHAILDKDVELYGDRSESYLIVKDSALTEILPKAVKKAHDKKSLIVDCGGVSVRMTLDKIKDVERAIKSSSALTYPGALLRHEEHDAIIIPPGIFTNHGQHEYTSADMAPLRVAD